MSIRPVIIRYADPDERPRASRARPHDAHVVRRDSTGPSASAGAIITSAAVAQSRRTTSTTLDLDRARSMSVQPQQSGSLGNANAKGNAPINISAHSFSDWSLEQVESDLHKQAHKHVIRRMRQTWLDIEHRHTTLARPRSTDDPHAHSTRSSVSAFCNTHIGSSRAIPEEDDDIIDLETMQIVQDRGMLRRIKNGAFALEPRLCGVYQTDLKVKNKVDDEIRAPDPADDDYEWQSDDERPPGEDPEEEEEDELARMDDLTSQPSYEYFAEKRRRMNERQSLLEFHRAELYARRAQSEAMSSRAFDDDPEEEWSRMEKSLQASFGGNQVLEDIDPGHGMPEDSEGDHQEEEDEFDAFCEDALPKRLQDRLRRKRRESTIHQLSPSSPRARSMAPFRRGLYHKTPTTLLSTKNRFSSIKRTGPTFDRSSTAPLPLTKTTSPGSSSSLRRLSIGLGQVKLTSSSPLATRPVISGTHPPSESSSDPPSSSMSPQRQKGRPKSILRPVDLSSERESSPTPLLPREPSPDFERSPTPDFPRAPTHEFQRPPTPPLSSSSSHAAPRPHRIRQHSFSLVIEPKVPSPKPYVLGEPPLVRQPRRKGALSSSTTQAQSPAPPRLPLSPSPTPGPSPSRRRRAESTTSTTIAEMTKQASQTLSASPAKKHKFEPFINQILDPLPEYDALDEEESEDELGWDRDRDRSLVGDRAKRRTLIGSSSRRASSGLFKMGIKRVRRRASSTFEYSSVEAKRLAGAEKEDEPRLRMTGLPTPPTSRGAEEAEASRSLMLGNGSSSSSGGGGGGGAERSFSVVPFTSPHRERPQNQRNRHRCSYPPLNHPSRRTSFPNPSTHFSPTLSTTRQLNSETSWVPTTYLTPEGFRREGTVVLPSEDSDDGPTQGTGEEDGDGSEDELMLGPWGSRDDGLLKKKTSECPPQSQGQTEAEAEAEQDDLLEAGSLDPPPRGSKSTFSSPLLPSSRSRLSRSKTIILDLPPLPALPEESEDELDCI